MVLLDLQMAFDTVDHMILCRKLQAMGIHFGSVNCFNLTSPIDSKLLELIKLILNQ